MSARLTGRLVAHLRLVAEQRLLCQAASLGDVRAQLSRARARIEALEGDLEALRGRLDPALDAVRFTPRTTVGRALSLHPGVTAVLADYHLDRCDDCPVRHDESLEELARGHEIPLELLLSRLDALLSAPTEG